jgi:hypothetical protein
MPRSAPPARSPRRLAGVLLAAALAAATACGRGDNQSADRNGADTTSADTSRTGPFGSPVGTNEAAKESSFARARGTLDSLQDAGRTPADGLDSMGARVQATTANEPNADTSRLNNRATPGGASAGGRRVPQ